MHVKSSQRTPRQRVTPTEWHSRPNAPALAAKLSCSLLYLKWERVVVHLIVKTGLSRTRSCPFTDYRKLKKREANGSLQFAEVTGTQKRRRGFALAILCQVCCPFLHTYLFCVTVKSCQHSFKIINGDKLVFSLLYKHTQG